MSLKVVRSRGADGIVLLYDGGAPEAVSRFRPKAASKVLLCRNLGAAVRKLWEEPDADSSAQTILGGHSLGGCDGARKLFLFYFTVAAIWPLCSSRGYAYHIYMPHVHTDPGQHDLTASAYVFRIDGSVPKVLLHWHKKLNFWMQFGGHVELHETPWATVAHELQEESGYSLDQLQLLQPPHALVSFGDNSVMHPLPFIFGTHPFDGKMNHFHTNVDFLFTATTEPKHTVSENESTTFKLFTREEIAKLPDEKILRNVRMAALYAFDLLTDWQSVDPTQYSQASPKLLQAE